MDVGVRRVGFNNIVAVEQDAHRVSTLRANASAKVILHDDIRSISAETIPEQFSLSSGDISLLHGGPPCQPFSQIGKRRGVEDPRGLLVFQMVRFAEVLRPKAVLVEQVPSFIGASMGEDKRVVGELHRRFGTLGYELHVDLLDAQSVRLPQNRKRAFIVAVPSGSSFSFGFTVQGPPATVGEVFADMPPPALKDAHPDMPNHVDITPPRDRERISYVSEGPRLSKTPTAPPEIMCKLTKKDTRSHLTNTFWQGS